MRNSNFKDLIIFDGFFKMNGGYRKTKKIKNKSRKKYYKKAIFIQS